MPILLRCHSCLKKLSVADRKAGATVRCPSCGTELQVPVAADSSSDEPQELVPAAPPPSRAESWFSHPVGSADDIDDELSPFSTEPLMAAAAPSRVPPPTLPDADDNGIPILGGRIEVEEMDLTPMVDMTFLLLIFFMITASFSLSKTIQVPVPDPEKQGQVETQQEIEDLLDQSVRVDIDAQSVIRVDDEVVGDRSQLAEIIRDKSQNAQRNELILIPDRQAMHEVVVAVVDAAYAAGMQKIRLSSARVGAE